MLVGEELLHLSKRNVFESDGIAQVVTATEFSLSEQRRRDPFCACLINIPVLKMRLPDVHGSSANVPGF
jgi:hypothetical protein